MRTFENAYDAYWFIYHHPNAVEIANLILAKYGDYEDGNEKLIMGKI